MCKKINIKHLHMINKTCHIRFNRRSQCWLVMSSACYTCPTNFEIVELEPDLMSVSYMPVTGQVGNPVFFFFWPSYYRSHNFDQGDNWTCILHGCLWLIHQKRISSWVVKFLDRSGEYNNASKLSLVKT